MSDINELLKINVDFLNKFPVQGSHLVDHPHELEFSRNIRRLKEIENRHNMGNSVPHFNLNIDEVIAKVRKAAADYQKDVSLLGSGGGSGYGHNGVAAGYQDDFPLQELRLLSWHLIEIDDLPTFSYALMLLEQNWRYLFLNGLSFCVLNSWNEIDKERRNSVCSLIQEKLASYDGPVTRYKKLQEHADFFDPAGPLRLARLLSVTGKVLTDAPTLLGYKPSAITQSFYSDVIRTYVKDHAELLLKDVIKILLLHRFYSDEFWNYLRDHEELSLLEVIDIGQLHKFHSADFWNYLRDHEELSLQNAIKEFISLKRISYTRLAMSGWSMQDRTTKLVLCDLVIRAEEKKDTAVQLELRSTINRILGDITLNATWAPFIGANEEDKRLLNRARELVNKWLARDSIKVFFEVCVQDPRRKAYWLRYVDYVHEFKVVGSYLVRSRLKSSPVVSDQADSFFISINSTYSETAALVMHIRNKVFIEFSDLGALYIYNDTNRMVAFLRAGKRHIRGISDLKDTYLPTISETSWSYYTGEEHFPPEGRLVHGGSWEDRLNYWMRLFFEQNSIPWPPKGD
jgi:hypothetical protein